MSITRRLFIKSLAFNSAAAAAASMFPGISFGAWKNMDTPPWHDPMEKGPLPFLWNRMRGFGGCFRRQGRSGKG